MRNITKTAAAIVGVAAVTGLMVIGSHTLRSVSTRTAEDACPIYNGEGGVTWRPCSTVASPSPAPIAQVCVGADKCSPVPQACIPGEGSTCPPVYVVPTASPSPEPGQPASGHVNSGPSGTIQASCNIIFASPYATLIVYVVDSNGHLIDGAAVSAHLVGPNAPPIVVSGTTSVGLATHQVHQASSSDLSTLPVFAEDVMVGNAVTMANYQQFSCHGTATYNGASASF